MARTLLQRRPVTQVSGRSAPPLCWLSSCCGVACASLLDELIACFLAMPTGELANSVAATAPGRKCVSPSSTVSGAEPMQRGVSVPLSTTHKMPTPGPPHQVSLETEDEAAMQAAQRSAAHGCAVPRSAEAHLVDSASPSHTVVEQPPARKAPPGQDTAGIIPPEEEPLPEQHTPEAPEQRTPDAHAIATAAPVLLPREGSTERMPPPSLAPGRPSRGIEALCLSLASPAVQQRASAMSLQV
jgi:hypothetical protein